MQTDVKSTHLNGSGAISPSRARLKGFSLVGTGTAGFVQFRDGSASGTILCEVDVPGNTNVNSFYTMVPGEGILFQTSIYAVLSNLGQVTAYYG
jgi:hypothetical protein